MGAAPATVNMSCNCCVVAGRGGLAGGSLGAGVGGKSWIACIACMPVGGDAPRFFRVLVDGGEDPMRVERLLH